MIDLAICVPVRDEVKTHFALSLSLLVSHLSRHDITHEILFESGTLLPQQRQSLAEQSMEISRQTLWLDSDMQFPPSIYHSLNAHNKNFVACTYSTRNEPHSPVAFSDLTTSEVKYLHKSSGLHQACGVGMGCVLMNNSVLHNLPKPWFSFGYHPNIDQFTGEDIFFCELLTECGIDILIDFDASKSIVHHGNKGFTFNDIQPQ